MRDRIRSDRNFHSVVFVPRDLMRLITRERVALSNRSKNFLPGYLKHVMPIERMRKCEQPYGVTDRPVFFKAAA